MDAKKEIFVKSLRKLLTITACLSHNDKYKLIIPKKKKSIGTPSYVTQ